MVTSYPEIRDRIYTLARQHDLRPDWRESSRSVRLLLLYDRDQAVAGRAMVPVRNITQPVLDELERALEHLFGKGWLQ